MSTDDVVAEDEGPPAEASQRISTTAAISIGIGGMIGAGIFSILGVVASIAGGAMPVSFAIGGVVALFAAYSYVKLGTKYPTAGGAVTFVVQGYGDNLAAGTINVFMYFSYVITIALYAQGFAGYAKALIPLPGWVFSVGIVVLFTLVNFIGDRFMGRIESLIVAIKVGILLVFVASAIIAMQDPSRLSPVNWPPLDDVFFAAGVLFVGYEGFGLITNAAGNMKNPQRQLPRAVYTAIAIVTVIYVLVAAGTTSNLPLTELMGLGDSALAIAAEPALGRAGFVLIAIAALLSTASAVNATLFGSANVAYQISADGNLPQAFTRQAWGRDVEGLFITAIIVIVFVLVFPLRPIAMMGSAGFLLVYAAVSYGHFRIRHRTGAKGWAIIVSVVLCLALFVPLSVYIYHDQPTALLAMVVTLVVSLAIEIIYRRVKGRSFAALIRHTSADRHSGSGT